MEEKFKEQTIRGTKVCEILEKTWAVEDTDVRFFIAAGEKKALVIDTGMTGLDVRAIAAELTDLPPELVNTHADMDHIGSNDAFDSLYMHPSEYPFYLHGSGHGSALLPVFEGSAFDLGGRVLEVIHVPGHTPGSITLLDRENRCLIGGDPIQAGGAVYMFGPHRDMHAYIYGLAHVLRREKEFDYIFPSHAKRKVHKDIIPYLIDGARRILDGKVPGTDEEVHGMPITVYNIGVSRFFFDRT